MKMLLKVGLVVAAVAVAAVVVTRASAQPAPERPQPEAAQKSDSRFEVKITDEMLRHSRIRNVLYFVGVAWSLGVLLLVLMTGASRKMRDIAARAGKGPFITAVIYLAMFTLLTALLEFPLSWYSGFRVPHEFDLSNQSFAGWFTDEMKGLGVSLLIGSLIGAFALLGIRKVRRWWLALWAVSIPLIILMVVIQPIVLDPIFNKFEPLQDQVLRQKLLDLASKAGIEGGRVYQVNKSKQTKTMNAYVNGIGPTNRIVMWDTLLAKMSHREVLGVMGHEMGHYVMKHIWKGLLFSLALSFGVFFVVQKVHDRGLAKLGPRWGFSERGDPASVPWLLLIASVVSFLLSPVINGYSRYIEHDSDIFALEVTRDNEALATAFVKFAEDSKQDPTPHPLIEFWRYSHPPLSKRIDFALSYKPWERGEPNRLWSGTRQQ